MKKNKKKQYIYFILVLSLFLFFYKSVFISLAIDSEIKKNLSNTFNVVLILLLLFSIPLFKIKEVFFIFILVVFFAFNFIFYDNIYMFGYLILAFMLMLSNRIEWSGVINSLMLTHLLVIAFTIPVLFFVDDFSMYDDRFGYRITFGFHNPNTFSQYLISLYVVTILFLFENLRNVFLKLSCTMLITFLLLTFVFFTVSRTGMVLSIMTGSAFLLCLFCKKDYRIRTMFFKLYLTFAILFCLSQFYMSFAFLDTDWAKYINTVLSGRVWLTKNLVTNIWPIPLFHGVDITEYMPIDFFYVSYFYTLGMIVGVFFVFIFFIKMKSQLLSIPMCVAMWFALVTTFTESYYTIPLYNVGLFIIFSKRKEKIQNENCGIDSSSQK